MKYKKEIILSKTRAPALLAYSLGIILGAVILTAYSAGHPGANTPLWLQLIGITHGILLIAVSSLGVYSGMSEKRKLEAVSIPAVVLSFIMMTPAFFQSIFLGVFMGPVSNRGVPVEGSTLFSFFYSSIFVYAAMVGIIVVLSMSLAKRLVWLGYKVEGDPAVERKIQETIESEENRNRRVQSVATEIIKKEGEAP